MATSIQTPLAEYLAAIYRPDCDFLDGEPVERNLGERDHSTAQMRLSSYLFQRAAQLGIHVYPEQRVQVRHNRFRVPDICVVLGAEPDEQILTTPPFLCIEILSRRDTMTSMQERIDDYLQFNVPFVWLIDPRLKRAYVYTTGRMTEARYTHRDHRT
jgi:Uma2 family endonuclease